MRFNFFLLMLFALLNMAACNNPSSESPEEDSKGVVPYLTTGDQKALLARQPALAFVEKSNDLPTITIDDNKVYQDIDGFGFTLTGGSADLIQALPEDQRSVLLRELFGREENSIGINYLRVSIGASDLSASTFSYNDLPAGQKDPTLKHFSIEKERETLIPVLKEIVKINPKIKILGSPWSAPTWMKTNNNTIGGKLRPEYYGVYADYFVKYVQAMADEGISIDAVTIQNEPLHPGNNPSMLMEAVEQADFIKSALGPAFKEAGITTKIILYDHNADRPDYPISILNDEEAAKYIDGSAFHLYGGRIEALSEVHKAHPEKQLYFTEQWVGGPGDFSKELQWHVSNLIIGATRNWSRNVLEWNLAATSDYKPHTDGGCTSCLGALSIDGEKIQRNVAYYIVGHASKFVPDGSKRIGSNVIDGLANVAFITPENKKVLVIVNDDDKNRSFNIEYHNKYVETSLASGAVMTYIWD
ncbi:glucosylceramidase [Olivibacter sp. SDN3]|uniref:glycoside hydrolase family 30 protein n=1 Tax=Olivibacter sp. SDN3 TaxID=2764720 RepID=UPI0016519ECF|nr:glycoside hydrolase family 30 beta sandwich domain-containing protein [Olivibacter sp. SDN3]QNL52286.1 glucosylceramidase [Olivibacter sp. SDN3]